MPLPPLPAHSAIKRSETGVGERLSATRALTLALAAPLSDADAAIQPFPDASPAKWHLAHSTWFFETFVLRDHVPGYQRFDERFAYLFNSYYEGEGERHPRAQRGMISRPSLDEVRDWRAHVDEALERALPALSPDALALIALGINHEQQHQECPDGHLKLCGEIPLEPAYSRWQLRHAFAEPLSYLGGAWDRRDGADDSAFAFDSERPAARECAPHAIAEGGHGGEWQEFIADRGYSNPGLWLSDGWDWVQREGITGPLYWRGDGSAFTLAGRREIDLAAPVAHVSFFEADAFARWAGQRLPSEAEWESPARAIQAWAISLIRRRTWFRDRKAKISESMGRTRRASSHTPGSLPPGRGRRV